MSIDIQKTLNDFLQEIGDYAKFYIGVKNEEDFRGDFIENEVLADILKTLRKMHPISLNQLLRMGGNQICEAGINIAMHGEKGATTIILYVGNRGIVYAIRGDGAGFDIRQVLEDFHRAGTYYKHKGYGLKSFDKPHVAVTFADGGRTTIIKCLYDSYERYCEYLINTPIKMTSIEILHGRSLQEAMDSRNPELLQAVEDYLLEIDESQALHVNQESAEWGYHNLVGTLRERLNANI